MLDDLLEGTQKVQKVFISFSNKKLSSFSELKEPAGIEIVQRVSRLLQKVVSRYSRMRDSAEHHHKKICKYKRKLENNQFNELSFELKSDLPLPKTHLFDYDSYSTQERIFS